MTGLLTRFPGLRFPLSRVSPRDALAVLVATVLSVLLQGRDVSVPLIPGEAVVRTSALLPLLIAVPLVATCANPMPQLEAALTGRRLRRARAGWAIGITGIVAALSAGAAWGGDPEGITATGAALNAGCFAGLGLLGAAVLGADLAWNGPCVLALVTFFFGKDADNQIRAWAWLLHDPAGAGGRAVCAALLIAGISAFTGLDSIGLLRRKPGTQ